MISRCVWAYNGNEFFFGFRFRFRTEIFRYFQFGFGSVLNNFEIFGSVLGLYRNRYRKPKKKSANFLKRKTNPGRFSPTVVIKMSKSFEANSSSASRSCRPVILIVIVTTFFIHQSTPLLYFGETKNWEVLLKRRYLRSK